MKRAALLALSLLAGCAAGPDYRRPAPLPVAETGLRESTGHPTIAPSPLPARWWRLFEDPELDRLVDRTLARNTDLRVAAANLQQARAFLSEARSRLLPTSDVSAQYARQRTTANGFPGGPVTGDYFTTGFDASYELDLFGGVRRSIEAARGDAAAAQAAVDAARVSVAAETARAYASACAYAQQADVARETEALQARTLDLTQRRLSAGGATMLELDQARALVEQARAQVPFYEAERRAALYALAVLTGDPPATIYDTPAAQCRTTPAARAPLPVGDGQTLLARRPDVRQAERQLAADVARVGVATAALYPSITLLGGVSLTGTRAGDIGKDKSFGFSLGPLISWNFPFNGAARARVRENRAIADGSLARFDAAVLRALGETEQALARAGGASDREAALARALAASSDAARLSRLRFDEGADSFFQLLDAERERASARAALAQAAAERADAQISVFKALGGGWEEAPPVVERSATGR